MTDVAPGAVPATPALQRLTRGVAEVLDEGGPVEVVTGRIAELVGGAAGREDLLPLFEGQQRSFAAYVDPQRHFLVHCSVHAPGHVTEAHDHGEAWAVYGVLQGRSRYRRFRRGADPARGRALLLTERDDELAPGATDVVPAGQVHLIGNETEAPAWNLVIRPRPVQQVWRRRYDLATGTYQIHPGSIQSDATPA